MLTDLVSILYIAAKKFGPGFVSVYKGKGNANLLRNRGMWCGLRNLQENLSFKQSDLKKGLEGCPSEGGKGMGSAFPDDV